MKKRKSVELNKLLIDGFIRHIKKIMIPEMISKIVLNKLKQNKLNRELIMAIDRLPQYTSTCCMTIVQYLSVLKWQDKVTIKISGQKSVLFLK